MFCLLMKEVFVISKSVVKPVKIIKLQSEKSLTGLFFTRPNVKAQTKLLKPSILKCYAE